MTSHELDQFLEALAENLMAPEETDVVSLLWEKDLSSILYIAIDEIFNETKEPPDSHSDGETDSSRSSSGVENRSSGTITLTSEDRKRVTQAGSTMGRTDAEQTDTGEEISQSILLNDQELEEIRRIVSDDEKAFNPPRELADALFEMLRLERDPERCDSILKVLKEYLSGLVSSANFEMACDVILALSEIERSSPRPHSEDHPFAQTILEDARSPRAIERIKVLLRGGITGSLQHLFAYLTLLGPSAASVLVDILTRMEDPQIRSKARTLLAEFVRKNPRSVEEWLFDPRVHLVKQVVSILGQPQLEEAIPYLDKCVFWHDADIRKEVIRSLSRIGGTAANTILAKFFTDPDPQVRVLATRCVDILDPDAMQLACGLISAKQFFKTEMLEKKAWVDLLRKTRSDTVVPILQGLLRHRTWFKRKETDQFRSYVASALGSVATEAAMQVLLEGTRMRNRRVRTACQHALERAQPGEDTDSRDTSPDETSERA
jgi:HEAT repeat protein